MMRELAVLTQKGMGEVNEDIAGSAGEFAWVLDGATDVFHKGHLGLEHEVRDYVQFLDEKLRLLAVSRTYRTPENLLYAAVKQLEADLAIPADIPEYELPTFAAAMVRLCEDGAYLYAIGDCEVRVHGEYNEVFLRDHRISPFAEYNRAQMRKLGIDRNRDPEKAREIYRETRKSAGLPFPHGYPIGTVRGRSIREGENMIFGSSNVLTAAMWSDGWRACMDERPEYESHLFDEKQAKMDFACAEGITKDDRTLLIVSSVG